MLDIEETVKSAVCSPARRPLKEPGTWSCELSASGIEEDVERCSPRGISVNRGAAPVPVDFAATTGKWARRIAIVGVSQGSPKGIYRSLD